MPGPRPDGTLWARWDNTSTPPAPRTARRTAQICGLVGGAAWVATYFLDSDGPREGAALGRWALLLTIALFAIGMMLVKSDVLPLRVFVALALPTLVWGVFALVRDSVSDEQLVDAVFGAVIGAALGGAPAPPLDGPPRHALTPRRRTARPSRESAATPCGWIGLGPLCVRGKG